MTPEEFEAHLLLLGFKQRHHASGGFYARAAQYPTRRTPYITVYWQPKGKGTSEPVSRVRINHYTEANAEPQLRLHFDTFHEAIEAVFKVLNGYNLLTGDQHENPLD